VSLSYPTVKDIITFTVHMTACDPQKSFNIDKTLNITAKYAVCVS